jgi:hypothetical protein
MAQPPRGGSPRRTSANLTLAQQLGVPEDVVNSIVGDDFGKSAPPPEEPGMLRRVFDRAMSNATANSDALFDLSEKYVPDVLPTGAQDWHLEHSGDVRRGVAGANKLMGYSVPGYETMAGFIQPDVAGVMDIVGSVGNPNVPEGEQRAKFLEGTISAALNAGGGALTKPVVKGGRAVAPLVAPFLADEAGALGKRATRPGATATDLLNSDTATPGNLNVAPSEVMAAIGHNGAPVGGLDTVDLPPGSSPRYRGAAPNRADASFPRYTPKAVPERMQRLIASADDPEHAIQTMFDNYIERGKKLEGSDWYNTEELRDWFVSELGQKEGDSRWREFVDLVGATSTGSAVPDNFRNATFYNALNPTDRQRVAALVKEGVTDPVTGKNTGVTPAGAARQLGIEVPNMPPVKGKGSYNYGHKMQRNHADNILNQISGEWMRVPPKNLRGKALTEWLQANPKVKGFANSMLGDDRNIAADKHFMRMLAMSDGSPDFLSQKAGASEELLETPRGAYGDAIEPYIKTRNVKGKDTIEVNLAKAAKDGVITDTTALKNSPMAWEDTPSATEYAALEEMAQRMAKKYGMTPAQFQANLWMGAGDITGLADESQGTAMELFRRMLDKRAGERGLTRRGMLEDFIINRAPLSVGPMGAIPLLNYYTEDEKRKGGT